MKMKYEAEIEYHQTTLQIYFERPVAIDGKVEIRPIMYVALSYDHRIIDGKESVGFLVNVKELLENPEQMLFASEDPSVMFPNI